MRVCILGSSPVAPFIVHGLAEEGHQITYIASEAEGCATFSYSSWKDSIETIVGDEPLMDLLKPARVEQAEVFIALSEDDNRNGMAAQMAQRLFHTRKVVCLVQDPERVELYNRLGLTAVSPASIVSQVVEETIRS
jgi:trk system potassium uptake protein TrkA